MPGSPGRAPPGVDRPGPPAEAGQRTALPVIMVARASQGERGACAGVWQDKGQGRGRAPR
jgi:hypothetical protein